MKRNRYCIKAFTILELTIVMLLSAIVIGITYTAYSIMSHAYLDFTKKNESMGELIRVDELLKKDFEKSEDISIDGQTLTLRAGGEMVKYQLEPDFIIRNALITDTFKVSTTQLLTAFENEATKEGESDGQSVDDLSLSLLFKTDTIAYHYHKVYSSRNLFKPNIDALN